jgi:hypothetical protein
MITSNWQKLGMAAAKVAKNVGIVALSAVIGGIAAKKTKDAIVKIGDGAVCVYNTVVNMFQK